MKGSLLHKGIVSYGKTFVALTRCLQIQLSTTNLVKYMHTYIHTRKAQRKSPLMHVNSHASRAYFLYLWKERMHTTTCSQRKPIVVQGVNQQWFTSQPLQVTTMNLQWSARRPILVAPLTYIRLQLHIGIKVADEWQISLDYVRGSNIYVRGYLD